jgi:hypothetical protein
VIVNAVQSVAVVEEHNGTANPVCEEAVKAPVQASREAGIFFVEVDEMGWSVRLDAMSALLETASASRLWVVLPGKRKDRIPAFVTEGHSVGVRTLSCDPADVYS